MGDEARLLYPERAQLRWDVVSLDSQLPPDHPARLVWQFVQELDLSAFEARIKARGEHAGRPAAAPAVLLAVWLFATIEGVGAARAVERLCQHHAAYRWLCGGVPMNHDMLSRFRRDSGALLDQTLTGSLTALIAEGLITLDEAIIDGTKVQARAGRGSMRRRETLSAIEAAVGERVARLKQDLEANPQAAERRQRERALRAAEDKAARIKRAQQRLTELEQEKLQRAKNNATAEAKKGAPRASFADPQVRLMRMADGATRPAWNVQVATARGFIVTIEPTDRRNDSGQAQRLVEQITQRCGTAPTRLLADQTAMTREEIAAFAELNPALTVYSPVPADHEDVKPETLRKRAWERGREADAVKDWRARMDSEAGKLVYARRKFTEHVHAKMKNRGFGRMLVHGLAKVRSVCLLHALAHNLMQARFARLAAAAA
jgi:transposase